MNRPRTCLILGSGMGGLALGALLARAGITVTILEAHPTLIGGFAQTFAVNGYRFTAGPRYLWNFGKGQIGARFLEKCDLRERVPMVELDRSGFDHIYIGDEPPICVPNGWAAYGALLQDRFPHEAGGIARFFALCQRAFRVIEILEERGFPLAPWHKLLPACLGHAPGSTIWMLRHRHLTLQQAFDWCGLGPRVRAILYAHRGIFVLPPAELSFHAYVAATLLYHRGCYFPAHGFDRLVGALAETIEKRGGTILCGQRVTAVDADARGIQRVRTSVGDTFAADAVVVNFDPVQFLRMIAHPASIGVRLPRYQYSQSVSSLFLGVAQADRVKRHFGKWNIWYLASAESSADFADADPRAEPRMLYLNAPTLVSGLADHAPAGGATVTAGAPCSYRLMKEAERSGSLDALRAQHLSGLLNVIERRFIPGLRESLAATLLQTPDDKERLFHAPGGAIYGRAFTPQEVWTKVPFKGVLPNLYFVGAYVSFAGIAAVIQGACRLYQELTGDAV